MQEKKIETWFVSLQAENILPLNPQLFYQKIKTKQYPLVK